MKKHSILAGFGLAMLALSAQAQVARPDLSTVNKARSTESTLAFRIGKQSVSLGGLNQVLQQTGYPSLSSQPVVFGVTNEASRMDKPWAMISQFDFALQSANKPISNGTNTVRSSYFQYSIGMGYRIIRTEKFTLTPKLMISPTSYGLTITSNSAPAPSLTTALVNPGSQQTASFRTQTFVGDLGLSGQYRFPYGSRKTETVTDCGTVTETRERSLILGFDAGYRLGANARLNQSVGDQQVNSADNPAINLSGWYVTARLGFGTRYYR